MNCCDVTACLDNKPTSNVIVVTSQEPGRHASCIRAHTQITNSI